MCCLAQQLVSYIYLNNTISPSIFLNKDSAKRRPFNEVLGGNAPEQTEVPNFVCILIYYIPNQLLQFIHPATRLPMIEELQALGKRIERKGEGLKSIRRSVQPFFKAKGSALRREDHLCGCYVGEY